MNIIYDYTNRRLKQAASVLAYELISKGLVYLIINHVHALCYYL